MATTDRLWEAYHLARVCGGVDRVKDACAHCGYIWDIDNHDRPERTSFHPHYMEGWKMRTAMNDEEIRFHCSACGGYLHGIRTNHGYNMKLDEFVSGELFTRQLFVEPSPEPGPKQLPLF
jgi:hypothetical protein